MGSNELCETSEGISLKSEENNRMMKVAAVDKSDVLLQVWRKKKLKILFAVKITIKQAKESHCLQYNRPQIFH